VITSLQATGTTCFFSHNAID